jgi:predicted FMN-binding regulatory protein PaiB
MLVTRGAEAPIVSQIPFLLERRDGRLFLQGHLARPNPQVADFDGKAEALAMFAGPHAYVSPNSYETGPQGVGVLGVPRCAVARLGRVSAVEDLDHEMMRRREPGRTRRRWPPQGTVRASAATVGAQSTSDRTSIARK